MERVTDATKAEYVRLLAEEYCMGRNRRGMALLCKGFHDILPARVLRGGDGGNDDLRLSAMDLEMISAGMPMVDLHDWQRNCRGAVDVLVSTIPKDIHNVVLYCLDFKGLEFSLNCQYLLIAALAFPVFVVLIQCKDGETFFEVIILTTSPFLKID